ncbi:hypothetical protein GC101_09075 [Paenibacillus sp. LMG 31459]|uniref:SLH domain-containing protein n=1 Tax=Paenibacillus phytohabitans TaxID=2654978 RepID=A0ABX1YEW9_9BACL|nr:S-layer homology domain-containing protein [Paenibacillus phytohabitans]NOU79034.1 hypothetical protein [Paenibacillus phytohabitans]
MFFSNKEKITLKAARRRISILTVLTLLVSMFVITPDRGFAADSVLFQENFEGYTPGAAITAGSGNTWSVKGTAPAVKAVADTVTGSTYASINHPGTGSSYIGQTFENISGGMVIDFDINIPGANGGFLFIVSGAVNSTGNSAAQLQFNAGKLQKRNAAAPYAAYDTTHWYHYNLFFSYPEKKYTLTIEDLTTGQTVATVTEPFSNTSIQGISAFGFNPNAGGTLNIDNISVKKIGVQMDSLTIGGGTLTDRFESYYTDYTLVVPNSTTTLDFTPTASTPGILFSVAGGQTVASGNTVSLNLKDNLDSIPVNVTSSVYTGVYKTYNFSIRRLEAHPDLEYVETDAKDSKVSIGWTEPLDPTYVKANIYQVDSSDQSLQLVDSVLKGKQISTFSGLNNGTTYTYVAKAVFADEVESSGVTVSAAPVVHEARQMESLNRGLVAIKTGNGIYVGWRLLGTDPEETDFNLYRDGVKVNTSPITDSTNYIDAGGNESSTYYVRTVMNGQEKLQSDPATVWNANYLSIPIQKPEGGTTPDGVAYTYTPIESSAGDLDGDGQYEIVLKWSPSNQKDNGQTGYTGPTYYDAYKLDGTRMWRMNSGSNIRAGAHYNQFLVYDLDGDGKAEVAMKTADGTVDGLGNVIGDPAANYVNSAGFIIDGPEYLTVFSGVDGKALDTTEFIPGRGNVADWGDTYGNRVDRFLGAVAYLDGVHPSLVMTRGYYTRMTLTAYDFKDGEIVQRWAFDSDTPGNEAYRGSGNHQLSVADIDGDGKDEIVTGAAAIDDDGTGLWNSMLGHGDAMHVGDLDPNNPGLEEWAPQEEQHVKYSVDLKDAKTGRVIFGQLQTVSDTGRALTGDIDPRYPGEELWAVDGSLPNVWEVDQGRLYTVTGELLSTTIPSTSYAIWWDGDLSRELADHDYEDQYRGGTSHIDKWDYVNNKQDTLVRFEGFLADGTKGEPSLQADLFGDWREEIVLKNISSTELRIFTTTDLTQERIYTLMHDPQYRLSAAWQNIGYNQPPHPGFYLGTGMEEVPQPNIYTVGTYAEKEVEATLPAAPVIIAPVNGAVINDTTPAVQGTSDPGLTVTIILDGTAAGTAIAGGDGDWTWTAASALTSGVHNVLARVADAAGNTADSILHTFTIESQPGGTNNPPAADTTAQVSKSGNADLKQLPVKAADAELILSTFTDVEGHWAKLQIYEAAAKGIVKGDSSTIFRPNGQVTRAEFAAMLLRTMGLPEEASADVSKFTDSTTIPLWAKDVIGAAVKSGILGGYPDGTLRPMQTISRAEMAAMLTKAMKWDTAGTQLTNFKDDDVIPAWAKGYIRSAADHGILTGREGNRFDPDSLTTRAEAAVALMRLWHTLQ